MRIIVIDDEKTILTVAERILAKQGHEVLAASTGELGLQILEDQIESIDLILLDWALPGLTGLEIFEKIRAVAPVLPVIFSSGYQIDQTTAGLEGASHIDFLEKPYWSKNLLEIVASVAKPR